MMMSDQAKKFGIYVIRGSIPEKETDKKNGNGETARKRKKEEGRG